jgi:Tfp pilus assembly protein PilX
MSWFDTIFKFIGNARYNTITPTLTSGQLAEPQCDQAGRLLVSTQPINTSWSDGGTSAATRTVKSAAGKVYQLLGRNVGASDRYLFFYNAASKPADGSTAHLFVPLKVKAGEAFTLAFSRARPFSVGLCWVASSTDGSLTYDGAALFQVTAEYE